MYGITFETPSVKMFNKIPGILGINSETYTDFHQNNNDVIKLISNKDGQFLGILNKDTINCILNEEGHCNKETIDKVIEIYKKTKSR